MTTPALFDVAPAAAGSGCAVPDRLKPQPGPKVVGLDLSLTATGMARSTPDGPREVTLTTKLKGHPRLTLIRESVAEYAAGASLVCVEGPAFGAQGSSYHQLAGLWWIITHDLWERDIPTAIVPPGNLKRFATGKGNSNKDAMMLATARRFSNFCGDNNGADALWLCCMGSARLGFPLVDVPQTHRTALDGVEWPTLTGDSR